MREYHIIDTKHANRIVETGRPLYSYLAAQEWAMLRNVAAGSPMRYRVKTDSEHSVSTFSTGAL